MGPGARRWQEAAVSPTPSCAVISKGRGPELLHSRPPGCPSCGMSFGVSLELCLLQEKVQFHPVSWATETSDLSPTHCAICKSHRFLESSGSLPPGAASLSLGPPGSLLPHHPLFLASLPPGISTMIGISKMISETRQAYQRDFQNPSRSLL